MTKEQWYKERNKRTDTFVKSAETYALSVHIRVTDSDEYKSQISTYFALNVLLRWCSSVSISAIDAACKIDRRFISFHALLKQTAKEADPFSTLTLVDHYEGEADIDLNIGRSDRNACRDQITIDSNGWFAGCSFNEELLFPQGNNVDVFLGAAFAAFLANAELFRFANKDRSQPYSKWYSLWSAEDFHPTAPPENGPDPLGFDFGKIHLIGCGAIGSSFAFLFPFIKCQAIILPVDPDYTEAWNTTSSLLLDYPAAVGKKKKTRVVHDYLMSKEIQCLPPFDDDYALYSYEHDRTKKESPDVTLCFANEKNIWTTIQNNYPPVCFHATTSKSWGVHIGRHIPLRDNCIVCTFKDVVKTQLAMQCSTVEMPSSDQDKSHTAILPFLAPTAALIALAEMIKTICFQRSTSVVTFNMSTPEAGILTDNNKFGECDVCGPQTDLYEEFGPYAKHWPLSK